MSIVRVVVAGECISAADGFDAGREARQGTQAQVRAGPMDVSKRAGNSRSSVVEATWIGPPSHRPIMDTWCTAQQCWASGVDFKTGSPQSR